MAEELRVQVAREHYDFRSYAAKPRFCSYWHQVDEVLAFRPETLLLIGGGDGLVAGILRQACPALSITTFDFDAALSPDIIGDIRRAGIYTSLIRNGTPLCEVDEKLLCESPQLSALSAEERKNILSKAV